MADAILLQSENKYLNSTTCNEDMLNKLQFYQKSVQKWYVKYKI